MLRWVWLPFWMFFVLFVCSCVGVTMSELNEEQRSMIKFFASTGAVPIQCGLHLQQGFQDTTVSQKMWGNGTSGSGRGQTTQCVDSRSHLEHLEVHIEEDHAETLLSGWTLAKAPRTPSWRRTSNWVPDSFQKTWQLNRSSFGWECVNWTCKPEGWRPLPQQDHDWGWVLGVCFQCRDQEIIMSVSGIPREAQLEGRPNHSHEGLSTNPCWQSFSTSLVRSWSTSKIPESLCMLTIAATSWEVWKNSSEDADQTNGPTGTSYTMTMPPPHHCNHPATHRL